MAYVDKSSEQLAIDQRTAGSDDANVAGVAGSATQSGVALGGFLTTNVLGHKVDGMNNTLNITDGGAYDLARDFVQSYNATLSDLVAKQSEAAAEAGAKTNTLVESLLAKFGELVESKNTDGESSRNRVMLYIALAIAAVFGLWIWRKR